MTHQPAMFALERLHAELGGQILQNKKDAKRLAQAMVHVEAVLKMLEPGYDVRPIAVRRRKPNPWFKRGTVFRYALDALRVAGAPLTSREIVLEMLAAKGHHGRSPQGHPRSNWSGAGFPTEPQGRGYLYTPDDPGSLVS
jgi:hypothetical protein